LTFINHGCNSTFNVGIFTDINEFTADIQCPPAWLFLETTEGVADIYNPANTRSPSRFASLSTHRDMKSKEEFLDNYLSFIGSEENWEEDILGLRSQCLGGFGQVEEHQQEAANQTKQ
jgi:hypothetical protein